MPSRKRNKGKARKASKECGNKGPKNGSRELANQLMNNFSSWDNNCSHIEIAPPPPEDVLGRFLGMLVEILSEAVDASKNPIAAHSKLFEHFRKKHPDLANVWDVPHLRGKMASYLVSLGTECLLQSQERYTKMASAIALTVLTFEAEPSWEVTATVRDLVNDCNERETVRFFSKRIGCDCLKDKRRQLKSQPKLSVCCGCKRKMDRKKLMLCTGCNFHQYCSKECQKSDWLEHRECCAFIADNCVDKKCIRAHK